MARIARSRQCRLMRHEEILQRLRLFARQLDEVFGEDIELAGADVGVGGDQHVGDEAGEAGAAHALAELFVIDVDHFERLAGGFGGDGGDLPVVERRRAGQRVGGAVRCAGGKGGGDRQGAVVTLDGRDLAVARGAVPFAALQVVRHAVQVIVVIPGVADDRVGEAARLDGVFAAEMIRREGDERIVR